MSVHILIFLQLITKQNQNPAEHGIRLSRGRNNIILSQTSLFYQLNRSMLTKKMVRRTRPTRRPRIKRPATRRPNTKLILPSAAVNVPMKFVQMIRGSRGNGMTEINAQTCLRPFPMKPNRLSVFVEQIPNLAPRY